MAGNTEAPGAAHGSLRRNLLRLRPPRVAQLLTVLAVGVHLAVWGTQAPWGRAVWAGAVLATAGFGWVLWAWALFRSARTAICPTAQPTEFVQSGPYRVGRNPMYVGMTAVLLGAALGLGVPLLGLAALLFLLTVAQAHVPHEEARMRTQFGSRYETYAATVRRWL